jgi:hypothetical protein
MNEIGATMSARTVQRPGERGQIIVLFALALVAIVAGVGLVLDGGSTYAQRRGEQSASDLAALAAANDYLLNQNLAQATARARTVAASNGFEHGTNNVVVNVTITTTNGAAAKVDISAPHANNFASIVGMPTWTVSTTATAVAGFPDTAIGPAPVIFSIDAFGSDGVPKSQYGDPGNPYDFGDGNGDFPNSAGDISWTNFGVGNVNANEVRDIMDGSLVITKTIAFGEYIGQHNNGNMTTEYDSHLSCAAKPTIDGCYAGTDIIVPVVDENGLFQGWATFHVVSAGGGSAKHITGYFVSNFFNERLRVGNCALGSCPLNLGRPAIYLIN